jgi:DHA3 family macrolide efflux protein-like MFS transporter
MQRALKRPTGMFAFTIVWIGQLVSQFGSGFTWFALSIWAWQETGLATALALVNFFSFAPTVILSPVAGALVDRWNRKLVMMLSDLAAGLSTIVVLVLYATGNLQIWHLYITGAFAGAFQAFQWPAYSAAITTMMRKEQYGRANGMMSVAESASSIAAPVLAGLLIATIGIAGIMVIDIFTFVFALGTLALVHIPQPETSIAGQAGQGSLWKESGYGFRYILQRPSLLGLQLVFLGINLVGTFAFVILSPMILARTNQNAQILGTVLSASGIGGLVGGLIMSAWGGPKRRVHGVLMGMALSSLLGPVVIGLGSSPIIWAIGAFWQTFFIPILNGSNQALWQSKVAPDVQGRVFAVRRLIAQISAPMAMAIAGPLADFVFEPAMQPGSSLAEFLGSIFGVGQGAGMAVMMFAFGLLGIFIALSGYMFRSIRDAENILPDHTNETVAVGIPA